LSSEIGNTTNGILLMTRIVKYENKILSKNDNRVLQIKAVLKVSLYLKII